MRDRREHTTAFIFINPCITKVFILMLGKEKNPLPCILYTILYTFLYTLLFLRFLW